MSLSKIDIPFCIEFEYKAITFGYNDGWAHLFSFGTHDRYGGDYPQYALAFKSIRPSCSDNSIRLYDYDITEKDVMNWNVYKIYNDTNSHTVSWYFNNRLLATRSGNITSKSMYFNGSGYSRELAGAWKYIKIQSSIYSDTNNLYNHNNYLYGIPKS